MLGRKRVELASRSLAAGRGDMAAATCCAAGSVACDAAMRNAADGGRKVHTARRGRSRREDVDSVT